MSVFVNVKNCGALLNIKDKKSRKILQIKTKNIL